MQSKILLLIVKIIQKQCERNYWLTHDITLYFHDKQRDAFTKNQKQKNLNAK